jgi:thiamine biosynthesis lipoprotein
MTTALATSGVVDRSFAALGTKVRLLVTGPDAAGRAALAEREIADYDRRLSRFRPGSELCTLNADPREWVPASPLLLGAITAALWAAERSGGLVDPCLLDRLERVGYTDSLPPTGGLAARGVPTPSGPGEPARPHPDRTWARIRVDAAAGVVVRPAGVRLDLGGSGKGHVADRVAGLFAGSDCWVVDCGGDVRVGGDGVPQRVLATHPLGGWAGSFELTDAAVATSSVVARAWMRPDGRPAHHLIDPATGEPAWAGLLAATAIGRTTLEAETIAKVAVLSGPEAARRILSKRGGLLVHADGDVEEIR